MLSLFRLLQNETSKIFSIRERHKSRHKFGGTKVCKAEGVRKYFVNPKTEIEVFNYIICRLAAWISKISHMLSSYCIYKRWMTLFRGTCWLSITYFILLHVFHFFFFFLSFFVSSITWWGIEASLAILKIKQWSCS